MVNIDSDRLAEVARAAFDLTTNHKDARRWQVAIAKAKQQLESNPYIHLDGDYEYPYKRLDGGIVIKRGVGLIHENVDGTLRAEWPDGQYNNWPGLKCLVAVVAILDNDAQSAEQVRDPKPVEDDDEWPDVIGEEGGDGR